MHRFYLSPDECKSDVLMLTGSEAHHASQVLRLRMGEDVIVLDGAGGELHCRIERGHRKRIDLSVLERKCIPPLPFKITLLQAIPKGRIIESIIQKATELGVNRIVPLLTERVTTRLDDLAAGHKGDKWQQIAVEAIKQCGAAWLPQVEAPLSQSQFLSRQERFDLSLIASLQPGSRHPRGHFDAYRKQHDANPKSVSIWIGPEGDFTPEEVAAATANGALPVTLGKLVLRVETAAVYSLSVVNYELHASRD
jgi:16S rRNA (uracil1498-N3)-methyltransferase